jgi:hypothetical protein
MEHHRIDPWYKAKKGEVNDSLIKAVRKLDEVQRYQYKRWLDYVEMYTNRAITGFGETEHAEREALLDDSLVHNVAKNLVDTAVAKVATKKVRVVFNTTGGTYASKRKAKKRNKWLSGLFQATKWHAIAREGFRDACIFNRGFVYLYEDGNKLQVERVLPYEIIVDDTEAMYGKPKSLIRHRLMDRSQLIELFPAYKRSILECSSVRWDETNQFDRTVSDNVSVYEAWYLASGPDAKDGRYVTVIDGVDLQDITYECDDFPFVSFHWTKPIIGYWGHGIVDEIKEKQLEINHISKRIQNEMDLAAPKIFARKGSGIPESGINNEPGAIIEVNDPSDMQLFNPNFVAPELFQQKAMEIEAAHNVTGISQFAAQAKKPDGLDSGKAIREYRDVESERFQHVFQQFDESNVEAAEKLLRLAEQLDKKLKASGKGGYKILAGGSKAEAISYSDIKFCEDEMYSIVPYPSNFLPETPAGKLQSIQELLQAGFVTKEQAFSLLDYPDLESVSNRINAQYDIVERDLEKILDEGIQAMPEPFYNLPMAATMAHQEYQKASLHGYDDFRLEGLRLYIERCKELMDLAMQAQQGAMGPEGGPPIPGGPDGAPMGPDGAPPMSEGMPPMPELPMPGGNI